MRARESSEGGESSCDEEDSLFEENDDEASFGNASTRSLNIVRKDIQLMNVIRGIVILVILTMTVISADCVFVVTTEAEEHNFKVAMADVSAQLHRRFHQHMEQVLWMAQSLAVSVVTSDSSDTSLADSWPNVTVPNFASLVESPLHLTNMSAVTFSPLITKTNRRAWEHYAYAHSNDSAVTFLESKAATAQADRANVTYFDAHQTVSAGIYRFHNGVAHLDEMTGVENSEHHATLLPTWQMFPLPNSTDRSSSKRAWFNEASNPTRHNGLQLMLNRTGCALTSFLYGDTDSSDWATYHVPRSTLYYPVVIPADTAATHRVVASIGLQFQWETTLQNAVTHHTEPLMVVLETSCDNQTFSYTVRGDDVTFLGPGDQHDSVIDGYTLVRPTFADYATLLDRHGVLPTNMETACLYKITVYPTGAFKSKFLTNRPDIFRGIVLVSLFFIVCIFITFDAFVDRHQTKVLNAAKQSDSIVRSLFPTAVTDRLYEEARKNEQEKDAEWKGSHFETPKSRVKKFMRHPDSMTLGSHDSDENDPILKTEPIADLFPNTTVLFADLAGFTAWSSEREPAQVFVLLETVYRAMDRAAKRMNIFKVETIGDCYVAATGLPEPQEDHAERMAKFARKCLRSVSVLTKRLESRLGPGTADLQMRIGIHSGPVTAGVLRGQKARFQLFGDTMNMASRIESSGEKNRIHLSKETARLLPQNMVNKREDVVILKGKGPQETYWLILPTESSASYASSMSDDSGTKSSESKEYEGDGRWDGTSLEGLPQTKITSEMENLINWNVDVLKPLLGAIVSYHSASGSKPTRDIDKFDNGKINLNVQMVIPLPPFDQNVACNMVKQSRPSVSTEVEDELKDFVKSLATFYPRNPFHSFEHCSHVVLSATKLLKRILAPDEVEQKFEEAETMKTLHEHTFGIALDPICQFAVVFSALIHDVGHCGISNQRLAVEEPMIAEKYDHRSIAEQRSLDIAFELLSQPRFKKLRGCIYSNETECVRFRSVVVNMTMATDIFDKEWTALRNARWNTAFNEIEKAPNVVLDMNRKATIVLEHIILASDVAHTMQHFFIYQKWNERLFQEMYNAFLAGRSLNDPSGGWYDGELRFFDNYIIPLAHKLKECGVFGVNSDEYLDYAFQNRQEWEQKGRAMVADMVERAKDRATRKQQKSYGMDTVMEENLDDSCCAEHTAQSRQIVEEPVESPAASLHIKGLVESPVPSGCRSVIAPAGKLGLVLNTSERGLIRVDEVAQESPLFGLLKAGEYIVSVDGTPTLNMPAFDVGVLLNKNRERRLDVVKDSAVAQALVDLHTESVESLSVER